MTHNYSQPFDSLIDLLPAPGTAIARARVVIVGCGYSDSIAAFRLADLAFVPTADKPHDVTVLERGKEYALGEFPNDLADLPAHIQLRSADAPQSNGKEDALFDIRAGDGVHALVGSGLGGTSLINANVAIRPGIRRFAASPWPKAFRQPAMRNELDRAFDEVSRWLDVATPQERQSLAALPKYQSLARYAKALRIDVEPAPITVTLSTKINAAGIRQAARGRADAGNQANGGAAQRAGRSEAARVRHALGTLLYERRARSRELRRELRAAGRAVDARRRTRRLS